MKLIATATNVSTLKRDHLDRALSRDIKRNDVDAADYSADLDAGYSSTNRCRFERAGLLRYRVWVPGGKVPIPTDAWSESGHVFTDELGARLSPMTLTNASGSSRTPPPRFAAYCRHIYAERLRQSGGSDRDPRAFFEGDDSAAIQARHRPRLRESGQADRSRTR